ARFLGKSGELTELLKQLGKLAPEERKAAGATINQAKQAFEAAHNDKRDQLNAAKLEAQL
ncbi:phenylalanine--tRNA ligase subunit alpha, partial [Chromobacterium piscinae]